FDRPDNLTLGDSFTIPVGSMEIGTNTAVASASPVNLALYNGALAADVTLQEDVTVASTGVSSAGLVARYSGSGDTNMYLGALVGINGNYLGIIYRGVGGV